MSVHPFRCFPGATEIVDGRLRAARARRAESLGHDALVIPIVDRLAGS